MSLAGMSLEVRSLFFAEICAGFGLHERARTNSCTRQSSSRSASRSTEVAKINRHHFVWKFSADTLSTLLNATLTLLEAHKYSWKAYTSSLKIASHRRFIVATSV